MAKINYLLRTELMDFFMQATPFQVGKRAGQPLMAAGVPGLLPSRLFYVTDCSNGFRFLIDTGAEVSIIPPSPTDRRNQ